MRTRSVRHKWGVLLRTVIGAVLVGVSAAFVPAEGMEMKVFVGAPAAEPVLFAAEELQRYLQEATGHALEVSRDPALAGRHALCLASDGSTLAEQVCPPEDPGEETYRICAIAGGGRTFCGGSPRAVLYAVYDFLERELGYRWYFPYPEDRLTPRLGADEWTALLTRLVDREASPAFAFREREFRDVMPMTDQTDDRIVQQIDWWAKLRMNRFLLNFGYARDDALWQRWRKRLIPEIKRRGLLVGLGEHGSYPLFLSPERYARQHPDWFCEIDGERVPGMRTPSGAGTQFCTSHPEAVATYLDNFAAFVRDNPEIDFYYPAPNDVSKWCECDACRTLSIADRYLRLDNQVAEMLEHVKPGARVMHLAYSNHRLPPKETLPHPMIDVDVACWGRDLAYPLDDPRTMPGKEDYLDVFRQWAAVCRDVPGPARPRLLYHCKLMRHYWLGLHLMPLSVLDADFACARELGLDGFDFPLGFLGIWTKALNTYVVARKCWEPEHPAAEWAERFLADCYGDKAPEARRACLLVEEAFADRRYGSSRALPWHPERIAVRSEPIEGLGENASKAVEKLGEAAAIAERASSGDGAVAGRFRKLAIVLRRARDEQAVLVKLCLLMEARHKLLLADSGATRAQARDAALEAWNDVKAANDALESRYDLDEDLAGLYWAGASHNSIGRALKDWLEAIEDRVWRRVGTWETSDFERINTPITKRFDVTEHLGRRPSCRVQAKLQYLGGELGVSIRSVSLWAVDADGAETRLDEDQHGGFTGYVSENAVYQLDYPASTAPNRRYAIEATFQATAAAGAVAQRGCRGEVLLGLPQSEGD